jgi:Skp family chaperone for outer membrane proteins
MPASTRRDALTLGVGLGGLLGLAGDVLGQSPAANNALQADPKFIGAIGTVDLGAVWVRSAMVQKLGNELKANVGTRRAMLKSLEIRAQREGERLKTLTAGTDAHQKCQAAIETLAEDYETARQEAEEEFAERQAQMLKRIHSELAQAAATVARRRGLSLILKRGGTKLGDDDPKVVMETIQQAVVYADPRHDVTDEIVAVLNASR